MILNIYENKQVVKTYEADTYDLMFGTLEEVTAAVKLDEMKTGSNAEIIKMVGKFVSGSLGTVRGLVKDVFPGITDEELKKTKVSEVAAVLVDVVKYTLEQLGTLPKPKN